jgi:glutaminyl-peptide cyclotransferase
MTGTFSNNRRRLGRIRGSIPFAMLITVMVASLLAGTVVAVAQEAPPDADVACAVEPRPAEALADLWFDPQGTPRPVESSSPVAERALDATLGEPADAATVEAIEAVAQEWVACTNARDRLRAHALFTDEYASRRGAIGTTRDETLAALVASPTPRSSDTALSIGPAYQPRVFPDGQAVAMFPTAGFWEPGEGLTVSIAFEQVDGRWRIAGMTGLVAPPPTVPVWDYRVLAEYPHDTGAYTQGLVLIDGTLYEGTGLEGESELRRVELETGEVLQARPLDDQYFGEGIAVVGDRIYQLTWQSEVCLVHDRDTFELLETFTYSGEGWGLTTDGERLIMSDGSDRLTFRDPETFAELGAVNVQDAGLPVSNLNELEYIDGEVWANIYQTDRIVRIDPATGDVTGWLDMAGLLPDDHPQAEGADVLNGIAYDPASGQLLVTGKDWPLLFEIEPVPPE